MCCIGARYERCVDLGARSACASLSPPLKMTLKVKHVTKGTTLTLVMENKSFPLVFFKEINLTLGLKISAVLCFLVKTEYTIKLTL